MDDAVCAEVGGEFWFPEKGGSAAIPKRICGTCPVVQQCLEYALENGLEYGIWGGMSPLELRAQRRLAA